MSASPLLINESTGEVLVAPPSTMNALKGGRLKGWRRYTASMDSLEGKKAALRKQLADIEAQEAAANKHAEAELEKEIAKEEAAKQAAKDAAAATEAQAVTAGKKATAKAATTAKAKSDDDEAAAERDALVADLGI